MSRPHWRLILNGKATGNEDVREAVAALRERGVQLEVRVTWESGDAERYVAEAIAHGVDTIIAAGGDGTLSEVAETLAHREEPADALPSLGLLPLGTANDFATAAEIPDEPLAALELIRHAPARPVDLLRIDADGKVWWCANVASGGFGTEVTVETDEGLKKVLGGLAYLVTGVSRLGRIDPIQARVRAPGFEWAGGFIALGVGNGRQAGGGQVLCPEALIDDGVLDITVIPELSGEVASTFAALVKGGKRGALEQVAERVQAPWVEIEAEAPLTLNLDGEPVQARHFRIDCVPGRVNLHVALDSPLLSRA
ncbi:MULTISPECIES: lipid kinase YegS [Stenotrophomonas]|jgi:lipid kinase YegS|uniref:Probable lipid kinase YegS-like n=1 Tax=Stenotrophomonas bentonitica TaxID=1450134 RepID=A0ABU9JQ56_9GAMM|nr:MULTISPECIES: lipid kinase YegS [Stenotrophomonas]AOX62177.1 lipid kinase YegS [Stenotrophomonas sp. LM091]MDX5516715.1 lipid kinase YegS [Stenotrophomonas sp. RG-453]OFS93265.1 lipid kinase YegS [Stenotrophomonas sp. HMSC10F06]WIA61421.1 lipid kinase YegS [Stenotrophomonas sp. BIO128-Bstrain]